MNIKQRRLEIAIEKMLRGELQNGNLPTSREFISKVKRYMEDQDLSRPSLKLKTVRKGSTAYAEDINEVVSLAYEDLDILYKGVTDKYDTILKNFNKFDVEKAKLDYELNSLESHLKELALLYNQSGFLTSVYDVFDDLSKVDMTKTTAEVDIKAHQATLPWQKDLSAKLPTDTMIPSFALSDETRTKLASKNVVGQPSHALSENIDDVWAETVYMREGSIRTEGTFELDFQWTTLFNSFEIDPHVGSGVYLTFQYSSDGLTWKALETSEDQKVLVEKPVTYSFNYLPIRKLRIIMTKTESDHSHVIMENGVQTLVYGYVMGIKKLGFHQIGYADSGELYSRPLIPITRENKPFTISKVSLSTDEVLPNGTSIEYFVAMEPEEDEEPDWKAISPINRETPKHDQIIDFKNITSAPARTFLIDGRISTGEYRIDSLYANGIDFYRLGDVEGIQLVEGTEQLYVGRDSWGVKEYRHKKPVGHIPGLTDWEKPETQVMEGFRRIMDGKNGSLLEGAKIKEETNYLFTLGVFSRKEEALVSSVPISSEPIAIYVNNLKVYEGVPTVNTKVNYLFKTGWNEIKVAVYVRNTIGSAEGTTISLGFDPRGYGAYTYAKARALEKVSLFDLRYNVKSNDHTKYAIMETNGRSTIVLNHLVPDLEYDFYSDYIDGDPKNTILFKAVMTMDRDICFISPKINSYRLRFS